MLALSRVVVAVFAGLSLSAFVKADCARNYTVRLGDTCDKISAAQNVSTYQLAIVNPIINVNCSNLAVGMPLCLGNVGADCTDVHVVGAGDNCFDIDTVAGIDFTTLQANNPQVDDNCDNIYVGEVLCVADQIFNYNTTNTTSA